MALILVADDNAELRRMMRRVLTAAGHEVIEAADGNAALKLLERARPALVITDLIMPGKEGIETIIAIRRAGYRTKILAMTGGGSGDDTIYLDAAKKLGADTVLRKPFRALELGAIVKSLLNDPARSD